MTPVTLALLVCLQSPGAAAGFTPNCAAPPNAAITSVCAGEELMRHAVAPDADDDQRDTSWEKAAQAYRRGADLARDTSVKKYALEKLEVVYDETHLDRPRDAEPVMRELIGLSPGELAPLFKLAHAQERQEQFDAAESTLLGARQMKPDDVEPYRELAQFFARRAAALSADKERRERPDAPRETDQPDKDGVYRLREGVQPPEQLSSVGLQLPREISDSGIKGSVAVEIVVGVDGRVTDMRIVRSVPLLDAAALQYIRQMRWTPATRNGIAVPVRIMYVVNF